MDDIFTPGGGPWALERTALPSEFQGHQSGPLAGNGSVHIAVVNEGHYPRQQISLEGLSELGRVGRAARAAL